MNLPSTYVYTMPLPKYADRMYFISVKLHYKLPKLQLKLTSHFQENIPEITGLASTSQSRSTVPPMSTNTTHTHPASLQQYAYFHLTLLQALPPPLRQSGTFLLLSHQMRFFESCLVTLVSLYHHVM